MSGASAPRIRTEKSRDDDVSNIAETVARYGYAVEAISNARELRRVVDAAQELGLEVEDRAGITWHGERLLETTHGHSPRRSVVHGILILRPHDGLPPGIAQAIAEYTTEEIEAGVATQSGRIIRYAAGATPDPSHRWVIGDL